MTNSGATEPLTSPDKTTVNPPSFCPFSMDEILLMYTPAFEPVPSSVKRFGSGVSVGDGVDVSVYVGVGDIVDVTVGVGVYVDVGDGVLTGSFNVGV